CCRDPAERTVHAGGLQRTAGQRAAARGDRARGEPAQRGRERCSFGRWDHALVEILACARDGITNLGVGEILGFSPPRGRRALLDAVTASGTGLFDVFRSRKMLVLFLLGFSGGLPLLLTGQTLQAWMTDAGVPLGRIADLSAVGLAYTLKFA